MLLEPGQTLSHYRIAGMIGEGGMGEVYLAEDSKLKRTVALKVLPPDLAMDPEVIARFRREAEAVAALNHPNIVTIHSVEQDGRTHFLTMEHVEGQSLDTVLPADGFPLAKVFDLAIQIADALSVAHERGVVHRDLKPANLMVTKEGRVKILDFGLAKLTQRGGAAFGSEVTDSGKGQTQVSLQTAAGQVMGTVPYMSPEQLQGQQVDHRTDLFSLGVLLYELSTGRRPFDGENSAALVSAILRDMPAPVQEINGSLPRHLGRIISHCLKKDPDQRAQSAKDVRNDLHALREELDSSPSVTVAAAATAVPARRRRGLVPAIGVVAVLALLVVAVLVLRGRSGPGGEPAAGSATSLPTAAVSLRRSVAVLGFKNLSGREDADWLSTALSQMLTTELAAGGELRAVPGEKIAAMKRDLSLSEGDTYSPETLARIRGLLGSDYVVLGSFLSLGPAAGGQLRLDLRLQDTAAGETVAALSETGTEAELLGLVTRTGERLRQELGAAAMTAEQLTAVRATLPASAEAARAYTEGLDKLHRGDALGARTLLEAAVAVEPDHPLVHAALAEAWQRLGYDAQVLAEAERAFQHSGGLPERERQSVEGLYREAQNEWGQAVAVYGAAWEAAPDDLEAGLRLARAQNEGGSGSEALETLAALRQLPEILGADPRIDLQEARVRERLGEYESYLQAASRARAAAAGQGARLLEAEAVLSGGWAHYRLGQLQEAAAMGDAALVMYRSAEDLMGQADAHNLLGAASWDLGDLGRVQEQFEQALALYRETGSKAGEGTMLGNLAVVLVSFGEQARAQELTQEALQIARELNSREGEAICLGNLGAGSMTLGDLETARTQSQDALAIERELGDGASEGLALQNLGWLSLLQGDLPAARNSTRDGLELSRQASDKKFTSAGLISLALVMREAADPETARRQLEESLQLAMEMEAEFAVALARMVLAQLHLDADEAAEAAPLADDARRAFRKLGDLALEVGASGVHARALAAQGDLAGAARAVEAVADLAGRIEAVYERLAFGIDAAYVEVAQGRLQPAADRLEKLRREAVDRGFVVIDLEARLLLGRIAARSGDGHAALAALATLQQDARARGFERIARLAGESG